MPKPRKKEEVRGRYYRWLLGCRNGVYFADGRSNSPSLGRPSLDTRSRDQALKAIEQLDLMMAVRHGLADPALLETRSSSLLEFDTGRRIYEEHVRRPAISGGPRSSTAKRYRAVLDKFARFSQRKGIRYWNEVDRRVLDGYASWLDGESYAYATEYLELTTLQQMLKFFVENDYLPAGSLFSYPLRKPEGIDTYCWRLQEVQAILARCAREELVWLRHVVIGLAATGMRISELASLRWSDLDLEKETITLIDESTRRRNSVRDRRTTKSGRGRTFPIHPSLLEILTTMGRPADGQVFHGPLGGKIKADTVRRILVRDVLAPLATKFPVPDGEIGFAGGRLHSFRHFFCSTCANNSIPERILMSWLGHRSSKMVHRYYHLHDQESRRQMGRIELY